MQGAVLFGILLVLLTFHTTTAGPLPGLGLALGNSSSWLKRNNQFSRRFVFEDLEPVPIRGTCKLSWYIPATPSFGNTVLCSGAGDTCLQPCSSGYEMLQGAGVCVQKCPDEAAGPAHYCSASRTCVRGAGSLCPVLSDVPYSCTAPEQFISSCAKQSYKATVAPDDVNVTCDSGLVLMDHTGGYKCVAEPEKNPCSAGFSSEDEFVGGVFARCKQVCPAWLVDCGHSCHMPGVPCTAVPEQLCPIVPLTDCDMQQRSNAALQTACQSVGIRSTAGCPLNLNMHGSCAGAKLQVAVGLRSQGFIKRVEVWWGPSANSQTWQNTPDGPLIAIRISFTGDKDPEVFGNESHTFAMSPRLAFNLDPSELVVSSRLWSSKTVMEGSRLTPVLAGFDLFTTLRNLRTAGGQGHSSNGNQAAAAAMQQRVQDVSFSGSDLGVGLPVGAAAYTSSSGIHAFSFVFLARVHPAKQEL